jgi:aconitate hydratase
MKGDIDYSQELSLDLSSIKASVAGPKRPQDRIELGALKSKFTELFSKPPPRTASPRSPRTSAAASRPRTASTSARATC